MISKKYGVNQKKIFDGMVEKMSNDIREKGKVVSNDDYILWLIQFLEENNWCNNDEKIEYFSLDKIGNLEKLNYFRDGILDYAKKNYIYPINKDCGWCYYIEYNGSVYQLSWFERIGRDVCYFDKVVDIENIEYIIKFDDLLNKKLGSDVGYFEDRLYSMEKFIDDELSEYIYFMLSDGIPVEAVKERTDVTINKMLKRIKKSI